MQAQELLDKLRAITNQNSTDVEGFLKQDYSVLNYRIDANSWSILECVEHLNRYFKFYIPEIQKQIEKAPSNNATGFKTGRLGNYFARTMDSSQNQKPMKTFSNMNPIHSNLTKDTLYNFLNYQKQLLVLLDLASQVSLTKTKTAISISKYIRLRLGDTLRVIIYHNHRHLLQAKRIETNRIKSLV